MASDRLQQLTADAAWEGSAFTLLMDLLPTDGSNAFLRPVPPDVRSALTYSKLLRAASTAATILNTYDPGSRIASALRSTSELAALFFIVNLRGLISFAPLNPELGDDEAAFELSDLPAAALILPANRESAAARAAIALGMPLMGLRPDPFTCGLFELGRISSDHPELAPLRSASPEEVGSDTAQGNRESIALVMHTSGTTRRPKLVPLTHGHLGCGSLCVVSTLQLEPSSVSINVMPLFHLHGLNVNLLATAVAGASVLCAPKFDAKSFWSCLCPAVGVPPLAASMDGAASKDGAASMDGVRASAAVVCAAAAATASVGLVAPNWYSAVPTIHQEVLRYAEQQQCREYAWNFHSILSAEAQFIHRRGGFILES